MNYIKKKIQNFIWDGEDSKQFQNCFFTQNSEEMEKALGILTYFEIINYDFNWKKVPEIKAFLKTVLPNKMIEEFEDEFMKYKTKPILAKCVKKESLDYDKDVKRIWRELKIEQTYEVIEVRMKIKSGNHKELIRYVDKDNHAPSSYVPANLFIIDLKDIPSDYVITKLENGEVEILPKEWTKKNYIPTQHSFWEDFYEDENKAVKTYNQTLKKLGIINVW